jgi:hypothetical protein
MNCYVTLVAGTRNPKQPDRLAWVTYVQYLDGTVCTRGVRVSGCENKIASPANGGATDDVVARAPLELKIGAHVIFNVGDNLEALCI